MSNASGWGLTARLVTKHFGALGNRIAEVIANFDPETATEADRDRLVATLRETAQVLATIDKLLAEAGTDRTRILMAQIFVANMKEFDGMNKAWDVWVADGNAPPRATIEARLASPDYKVEIVVTAAI